MLTIPFSVLQISIYLVKLGGAENLGGEWGYYYKQKGMYVGEGCKLDFFFISLLYGTPANISRKPATGGMASQHLRTFERMDIFKSADLNVVFI